MTTKEIATTEVTLEEQVGGKLAALLPKAPHVTVADKGDVLQIVARILDAEDTAAMNKVFSREGTTNSAALAKSGADVILRSMTLRRSDYPDQDTGEVGWYAQFDAAVVDDNGEPHDALISTSSLTTIAAFVAADSRGLTPAAGRFVQADKPSASGFYPIHFEFTG